MPEPITLASAMAWARGQIEAGDARVLLCHVAGVSRSVIAAFGERPLDGERWRQFQALVRRRGEGEPVAYLTGEREFFSRPFRIGPGALIPRPETEGLVEAALAQVADRDGLQVLDLGTGSGVIAITLALELGGRAASVIGVDRSSQALGYAAWNAAALGASVDFRQGDWFAGLEGLSFDLIVANPPYVAAADPHLSAGDLRYEPIAALASGADGLDDIRRIVEIAPEHLFEGGVLLFEHGYDQAPAVRGLLRSRGFAAVESVPDLAGIERVTFGHRRVDAGRGRTVD